MPVYASICKQQVAGVMEALCMVSICMYLHVYACILTVHGSVTVNTSPGAKLPETVLQWIKCLQGTLLWNSHFVYCSFLRGKPSGSQLAKSWPRSWCRTGGCPSQGSPDGCRRRADSTQPCGRACSREWCRRRQLGLGAISPGCERVARHTGQAQDSGDTTALFQPEQCWATKVWRVMMGSNRTESRSGRTGTPWDDPHRCALASWRWD